MKLDEAKAALAGKLILGDQHQLAALEHMKAFQAVKELADSWSLECSACNGHGTCLFCGVECGTCEGTGQLDADDFEGMSTEDLTDLIAENT